MGPAWIHAPLQSKTEHVYIFWLVLQIHLAVLLSLASHALGLYQCIAAHFRVFPQAVAV
jgi:hypothetical protein